MNEKELLDQFVIVFKEDNYSPISGKILGVFYISNQKYFTFLELIEITGASKSAVSKSLKFLMNEGIVAFIFEKGSARRRLFYMDLQGTASKIQKFLDSRKLLNTLLKEVITERTDENKDMNFFITDLIAMNNELLEVVGKKMNLHFNKRKRN